MRHLFFKDFFVFSEHYFNHHQKSWKSKKIIISTLLTLTFPLPYMSSKCYINNQPSERSKWSSQFFLLTFKMTSPIPPQGSVLLNQKPLLSYIPPHSTFKLSVPATADVLLQSLLLLRLFRRIESSPSKNSNQIQI